MNNSNATKSLSLVGPLSNHRWNIRRFPLHVAFLSLIALLAVGLGPTGLLAEAASNQGCLLDVTLCDVDERCVKDGLFGQCYAADSIPPILLDSDLTEQQRALLRMELERLADEGYDWRHDRAQCILAYFKISVAYELNYDTEFCSVRNPGNILTLLQRIQTYLSAEESDDAGLEALMQAASISLPASRNSQAAEESPMRMPAEDIPVLLEDQPLSEDAAPIEEAIMLDEETGDAVPVILLNEELVEQVLAEAGAGEQGEQAPIILLDEPEGEATEIKGNDTQQNLGALTEANMALNSQEEQKEKRAEDTIAAATPRPQEEENAELTKDEDKQLNQYVNDILNKHETNIHKLSTPQLEKLIGFIGSLQETLETTELKLDDSQSDEEQPASNAEQEEAIPLTSVSNGQQFLLKKDVEKFHNEDMGLSNIEHKIVKGDIHRVEGNRVYIKVGKEKVSEEELYKLISYLDKKIAEPNNLYFNEFQYENGQLSFRISRLDDIRPKNDKRVDSASRVAQAVYKRRKDIQTLAGVRVDETGIGSGEDVVPVESSKRDWLFLPILAVCACTITTLVIMLTVHMIRNRRRSSGYKSNLPEILDHLDGKTVNTYEELCRQRMNSSSQDAPLGVVGKSASTSSWPDENLLQSCNLDISTGHVILSFLQEYLDNPEKIADQWSNVADYKNANAETTIGERPENRAKNVDEALLPYDENIVTLTHSATGNSYINASKIHDSSDPRQVAYIATQTPMEDTIVDFWHCVWEQGITLIVNLCDQEDAQKYPKYWPDEGARTYGAFEVHLVSEHIWSEDYMVRSFYLKNTETNETRTVTQFHYLAWPENGTPTSIKTMLEFRRKINKSYRGRASPILVHCSNGSGRTGTYCLIDIVVNRITKSGIKELNIDGSLEFLRDARPKVVANLDQYKLVFTCVAEEVNALLKNLQQQQQ